MLWFCKVEHGEQDFVIGSVIGVAAAPWLWLHFARSLHQPDNPEISSGRPAEGGGASESAVNKPDPPASAENDDFARYKFLSILLGIALLIAVLLTIGS
jgi:hypothetical protein